MSPSVHAVLASESDRLTHPIFFGEKNIASLMGLDERQGGPQPLYECHLADIPSEAMSEVGSKLPYIGCITIRSVIVEQGESLWSWWRNEAM